MTPADASVCRAARSTKFVARMPLEGTPLLTGPAYRAVGRAAASTPVERMGLADRASRPVRRGDVLARARTAADWSGSLAPSSSTASAA